jgi:hypothetical protein
MDISQGLKDSVDHLQTLFKSLGDSYPRYFSQLSGAFRAVILSVSSTLLKDIKCGNLWTTISSLHQFNKSFSTIMRFNTLAFAVVALLFNQVAATSETNPVRIQCMSRESHWVAC